jgi:hypothetical protein
LYLIVPYLFVFAPFPFFSPRGGLPEIYTNGMRNPWRCSFGVPSNRGALVCGDVGQAKWEKISVITGPALNMGWVNFEAMGKLLLALACCCF